MYLTVLGSAGWMPAAGRSTSCYAVRSGRSLLLLDAGTGIANLVDDPGELLADVGEVHIVLSHFHWDHTIGLTYLAALDYPGTIVVWGPGRHYDASTAEILRSGTTQPYGPRSVDAEHDIRDLPEDRLELADFEIRIRSQKLHSSPSVAFRVNDSLTYCTDTAYDGGNVAFAEHSRLLIHESWPESSGAAVGHTRPADAARIAQLAGTDRLMLSHVPPHATADEILAEATPVFPGTSVAREGTVIDLG
jgi:ribonuclease BN (tRNA processing enzyme)